MNYILNWDIALFKFINEKLSCHFMDVLMLLFSDKEFWIPTVLGLLAILAIFGGTKGKWAALVALIAIAINDPICARIIKPLIGRLRPSWTIAERLLTDRGGRFSFPSNHSSNSLALTTAVGFFKRKTLWLFIPISLIVGFSRIYVGVHYPLDVLAGFIIGGCVGWATAYSMKSIFKISVKPRKLNVSNNRKNKNFQRNIQSTNN